ncbi:MAG: hypothetical protein KC656_31640, partial [Myxococcales bacterium]|nr:hypothetical protein [Myxococcales bacterium]
MGASRRFWTLVAVFAPLLAPGSVPAGGGFASDTRSAATGEVECFDQVNVDGFGNPNNRYAWSMAVFDDQLYVGTYNVLDGGELWRYDGLRWENVMRGGFGGAGEQGVRSLVVHDGALFAGTHPGQGPAMVYRSTDGVTWVPSSAPGLGNPDNISVRTMISWNGSLYAGTQNVVTGMEVRRYDGGSWTPLATDGISDPRNTLATQFVSHRGGIYLGTFNSTLGAGLYRYDGQVFQAIVGAGAPMTSFDGTESMSLSEYRGRLYVGVVRFPQFSVWRSGDGGLGWAEVTPPRPPGPALTPYPWSMLVHGGVLYVGTWRVAISANPFEIGHLLWSTTDGAR